ncbi:mRNA cap guanine-N7 methyltransferase 2 isoform X3 [Jatropha curcas]|uniref:mRNA cap guanine-N7 methyltransferase 2 isoform X3 n=1 Tax=Jatropha curcas TaxID=180498 RepID=UPI0005FB7B4A|nr:mRNA cap guanine-N7 methyltransferase 2 isoform X3 [Jatropha curcas]
MNASFAIPRTESTHHRLYEFAKAALIKIFVHPYATVCDLYCGGSADAEKWDGAQFGHYIGIDVSSFGINEIREAWESQRKSYTTEFFEADPCSENFEMQLQEKANQADLVCCLQNLQLCFETEESARKLLHNVSSLLKPGGYFFGITPDSSTIWLAREAGLEYVEIQNLTEFYDDNSTDLPSSYAQRMHFAGMVMNAVPNLVDPRGRLLPRSFDVLGLYTTFIFKKPNPDVAPPLTSPLLPEESYNHDEREWQAATTVWRDDEKTTEPPPPPPPLGLGKISEQKGILGPGPADLRFSEAL